MSIGPRRHDAVETMTGRERQAPPDMIDRAAPTPRSSRRPSLAEAFADTGLVGEHPKTATIFANEIIRKPTHEVGLAARPVPSEGDAGERTVR